ncbi:type IV pilus biogenesis protein PilP [Salmonella enterica subsp. houtenae]|nr:type IV pilus biogenesis protein PilP [Salmonella enterica]ECH8776560.1 type IV pilus biogenesis protein PilP [Salmonella enterica subsp. houtenae]EDU8772421.1 type IV pilus biogenesis protein PilP [Salmonella enterica subsp. houtenae]EDV9972767.1 type IV pilus biogenesis protein PilP [Salmonella enterica subsp. houtenae]MDJ7175780.1 type IV pilus biogenesis protein PilP [Salmonella enterica]
MPKNSVFICGVIAMVFSAGAFSQPTSAIPPSAGVVPATSVSEPGEPATSAVSSMSAVDNSEVVPVNPGDGVTGGQLEELQAKNMLLEAQVQAARLQKELKTAETTVPADSSSSVGVPMMGLPTDMNMTPVQSAPAVTRAPGRIAVLEVSGRGKNLQATLVFPDGQRSVVQAGSALPGSTLKVKSISLSAVTLSDGQQLTF